MNSHVCEMQVQSSYKENIHEIEKSGYSGGSQKIHSNLQNTRFFQKPVSLIEHLFSRASTSWMAASQVSKSNKEDN